MMTSGQPSQRRRQRRLRSWWRHEQQSIAAALATVRHHSSGKVHTAYGAPRSQRLASRGRGGGGSRGERSGKATDASSSWERPAPLSEVARPQDTAVTVGHVTPLLAVGVPTALTAPPSSFLLAENLKLQKEEEETERRREREEAEYEAHMQELNHRVQADLPLTPAESRAWRKGAGHIPMPTRRRKKRTKDKLPRSGGACRLPRH